MADKIRQTRIPRIRFDKSNIDAPTVNRALDNIIDNTNSFINETVKAINDLEVASNPVDVVAGSGVSVVESPPNTFTISNTNPGVVQNLVAGTGVSIVQSPPGTFTVTNTLPENTDVVAGSGISVVESPTGTFTITNISQGGGGGGGGVLYYLNDNIPADAPTPVANTKEFGLTIQGTQTTYTQLIPKNLPPQFVRGYLSDTGNPNLTTIPAGIWEVNIWAINNATQPDEVEISARVYVWNGTSLTQIGISAPDPMINGPTPTQYTLSVVVPQTATNATDRIYVAIYAQDIKGNDHNLTLYYGGIYPSHTHTTIPYDFVESITAGTGIIITQTNPNEYTITNAGALLSGPSQTFTNPNTFSGNVTFVGNTQLGAGTTLTNNGTIAGGTVNATTYQNLPVQNLLAGTGISLANLSGTWTITNTGVPGPPGPAGPAQAAGGYLLTRTGGVWTSGSLFGIVSSIISLSPGTDPWGYADVDVIADTTSGSPLRQVVLFARDTSFAGAPWTQTAPYTYTEGNPIIPTPSNLGWKATYGGFFDSNIFFINEFSTKLATYPTGIGNMEVWVYFY